MCGIIISLVKVSSINSFLFLYTSSSLYYSIYISVCSYWSPNPRDRSVFYWSATIILKSRCPSLSNEWYLSIFWAFPYYSYCSIGFESYGKTLCTTSEDPPIDPAEYIGVSSLRNSSFAAELIPISIVYWGRTFLGGCILYSRILYTF